MISFLAQFKVRIIITAIFIAICGGIWFYVSHLNDKIGGLEKTITLMEVTQTQQKMIIDSIERDTKRIQRANTKIITQIQQQADQTKKLHEKFTKTANGSTRNFDKLVARKPDLIQKIINNSSADAFRCLEIASGSALTEKEKNARSINEINKECTDIANPNFLIGN